MAFSEPSDLPWFLALFNSRVFDDFIALFAGKIGGVQYEAGLIQRLPVPSVARERVSATAEHARRGWGFKRILDTRNETSHAFALPALLQVEGPNLNARIASYLRVVREVEAELERIESDIDESCFELYGIDKGDRRRVTEGVGVQAHDAALGQTEDAEAAEVANGAYERQSRISAGALAAELVGWAVGVVFGRFDVRLATSARQLPRDPEPFDPLPLVSPGMLADEDSLPADSPPVRYQIGLPENGVLVDDAGDPRDIEGAARAVFNAVFGVHADSWWNDTAALLDPKGRGLRTWLGTGFFDHHVKQYSMSKRKSPILWQLGTPSGRYAIWLYALRLTPDSLFRVQNDVIGPKLAFEERALTRLVQSGGGSVSASESKEIARQAQFVEELRAMFDETRRVSPLWNPDLDDGVVLSMAPLWRLVPQNKTWQKELKGKWDGLATGKYDWSHIAMHLWPERVIPKCVTGRSLAIAHGLEEEFWAEDANGKWAPRQVDNATVERLVQERSSAAVKWALADLLAAG